MNLPRPVRRALKRLTMRFSQSGSYTAYMPSSAGRDAARVVGDGTGSSVVMAPVLWACRTFPEAPVMVERHLPDGSEEEVVGHAMTALLRRPNPYFSGELLWWATIASLITNGNGYWIKIRDNQLRVRELWWAPPGMMEPKWPQSGDVFISHYEYRPGGEAIKLDNDDVVHFRYGIDPNNPRLGKSPLASVIGEVFSDIEAATYTATILKNMGVPGLVIAPDGDAVVSDEDMLATKASLDEQFTGRNRGKPFVAGAPTKVMQFGFSPQQMDMRTLRRLPEERVTAVLGIPAIVAGLGAGLDRSTFANMSEAREMAYESTIIPLQRVVASDLGNQMLGDFEPNPDQFQVAFDLSNVRVLQEDENAKVDRKLRELNGGAITLAEYRRETGREAGREHEVYLRPFSVTEVPAGGLGVPSPSSSAAPPPDDGGKVRGRKATSMQRDLIKEFMAREESLAGTFTSELVEVFMGLGASCAAAFATVAPKGLKAVDDDAALVNRIMATVNINVFTDTQLRPAFEKHYTRVIADTLDTVNEVAGLGVSLPDDVARRIVVDGGTRAGLVDVTESTRGAIFRSLAEARELGEGPAAAARRIRDQVPAGRFTNAGPQYRSRLIAKTETKFAQNRSSMEAYKRSEAVTGLLAFDAQGPGESDPDCEARNGQTFSFAEAELELEAEHPGGTLSFAPVV